MIQQFLPEYYKYLLMNPITHITPILGVFTLNITKNGNNLPVHFVLLRHIRGFDLSSLESDDLVFNFDIKGYLQGGRRVLDNPREILKIDVIRSQQQKFKDLTLKDQDFL